MFNLEHSLAEIAELNKCIKKMKTEIEKLENSILEEYKEDLQNMIKEKAEPYGTYNFEGFSIVIPKKVEWDEGKLESLYTEMGVHAKDYIKVRYSVNETQYKSWNQIIKSEFKAARTEKEGKLTLKIKETK